jgi:nitrogen fixation protein FixH
MLYSRLRRHEERRQRNRLILALGGMLAILIFLFVFGLKILVGFSLLVDRMRGNAPPPQQSQDLILPPVLDPLPEATNSARVDITGRADQRLTIILYIDEQESETLEVKSDGTFSFTKKLAEGDHTVSAKAKNDKDVVSDLSNVVSVRIIRAKPELTVTQPDDGVRIVGDTNTIVIKGKTASENTVTVNGRLALVASDGSFSLTYSLLEGENSLHIVATDRAGNEEREDRRVTYAT